MSEKREPREWWLVLEPNGGGVICDDEVFVEMCEHDGSEVVHVREVMPEEDRERVHDTAIALCNAYHARRREGLAPAGEITDAEMALDARYCKWLMATAEVLEIGDDGKVREVTDGT